MVDFIEQEQRQKRLIYVFLVLLLITAFVLWYGFFRQPRELSEQQTFVQQAEFSKLLQIDLSVLESPFLKQLKAFEKVKPYKGQVGRENPFAPF